MESLIGRRIQSKRDGSLATVISEISSGFVTVKKDDGSEINIAESTFNRWWGKPDGKATPAVKKQPAEVTQSTAEANKKKVAEKRVKEAKKVIDEADAMVDNFLKKEGVKKDKKSEHTTAEKVIAKTEKTLPKKETVKAAVKKIISKKSDNKKQQVKKDAPKKKLAGKCSRIVDVPAFRSKTGAAIRTIYKAITNSASGFWYQYAIDKVRKLNDAQKAELVKFIKANPHNAERQNAFIAKYIKG